MLLLPFFSKKTMSASLTSVVQMPPTTSQNHSQKFTVVFFECLWKYNLNRLNKLNPFNWLRKNKVLKVVMFL